MNFKTKAAKIKKDIPVVFLCFKDKETPRIVKLVTGFAVIYALSPIDLIPDFVPVIGFLDDIVILPLLISLAIKLIPNPIWERNKLLAKDVELDSKWTYSLLIIVIWLMILFIILQTIK